MKIISKQEAKSQSLLKYFTGKPCKQGHLSFRYVAKSTCAECLKLSSIKNKDKRYLQQREKYKLRTEAQKIKERKRLKALAKKNYQSNPEKYRKIARDYREKNKDKCIARDKLWKSVNGEALKEYRQKKEYKEMSRILTSRRRAAIAKRIPSWANLEKIEEIYKKCPKGFHVDHIVPLFGKTVSGLHCESNLRHLEASENHKKSNIFWPDMP